MPPFKRTKISKATLQGAKKANKARHKQAVAAADAKIKAQAEEKLEKMAPKPVFTLPSRRKQDPKPVKKAVSVLVGSDKAPVRLPSAQELREMADGHEVYVKRMEGWSITQIANRLGMTPQYAQKVFIACLNRVDSTLSETAPQMRQIENARLDRLQTKIEPILTLGETEKGIVCADTLIDGINTSLKISKARRDLNGLDAAQKLDIRAGNDFKREYQGFDPDQI